MNSNLTRNPLHRSTLVALLFAAGAIAPLAQARADGTGLYVGAGALFGNVSDLGGKVDAALASQGLAAQTSADSSSTNPGLRLGYQFTPNFALEGSYDRLGSLVLAGNVGTGLVSGSWKSWGLGLHAVGILPFASKWSLYGRLGVERWHTALTMSPAAGGPPFVSAGDDSTGLAVGAGVSYSLTRNVDATAELTHYTQIGDPASTGRTGMNQLSLGLRYHFR
ncbi:MAG: hypothetical protein OJF60_000396 [Burkholderiaceae bacterium]|nr:MAG: hypothetical protein OJF60_000396 [Burkholderiaceae bacterium]